MLPSDMVEGFRIIKYTENVGHILFCTYDYPDAKGFFPDIKEALYNLDTVRRECDEPVRPPGLRGTNIHNGRGIFTSANPKLRTRMQYKYTLAVAIDLLHKPKRRKQ